MGNILTSTWTLVHLDTSHRVWTSLQILWKATQSHDPGARHQNRVGHPIQSSLPLHLTPPNNRCPPMPPFGSLITLTSLICFFPLTTPLTNSDRDLLERLERMTYLSILTLLLYMCCIWPMVACPIRHYYPLFLLEFQLNKQSSCPTSHVYIYMPRSATIFYPIFSLPLRPLFWWSPIRFSALQLLTKSLRLYWLLSDDTKTITMILSPSTVSLFWPLGLHFLYNCRSLFCIVLRKLFNKVPVN